MPKTVKSEYEKATTEFGAKVMDACRNELRALITIVETRCGLRDRDACIAVRDAAQMLVAANMDLWESKLKADIENLQKQVSTKEKTA